MSFYKKVLVLKQLEKGYSSGDKPVSGIARVESENGVWEFFLSLINLAPLSSGEYRAFVADANGKLFPFYVGSRPDFLAKTFPSAPNAENFSIGVVFVDGYIPLTVAFATTLPGDAPLIDFKRSVADFLAQTRRAEIKKEESEKTSKAEKLLPEEKSSASLQKSAPEEINGAQPSVIYDDEAVATENYFDFDDVKYKLSKIEELDDDELRFKNELPYSEREEETEKIATDGNGADDEANGSSGNAYSEKNPYFFTVERELEEIFEKFPEEKALKKIFAQSRFAKVFYSETKYYVVGLVKENGKEKYVCYGVPAVYSKEPPKELKGFCSFIPLSVFSLTGDGYWMMFQDAVTGECVKPK